MAKKKARMDQAAIKALKKANRELEIERHGADHPWVAVDRPHKNRKKYNRKDQKKELRHTLSSFDFFDYIYTSLKIHARQKSTYFISVS